MASSMLSVLHCTKEHAMSETLTARTKNPLRSPADVYDEQFVPALFTHWGPVLCDAANITSGRASSTLRVAPAP
jgi:hypothetical protein